ncbi:MAG TPA: DUF2795 domain-containing protein [Capsulimonadaceae bacterium]|nr:DUF2795 domain-containing protein [Capsulimonadaceae bacterium]
MARSSDSHRAFFVCDVWQRRNLADTAQKNGAPSEVMEIIKQLPMNQFGRPQDVMKAYGQAK